MQQTLGLYIHIPFCRSKCDYCDFYSLAGKDARMDDYQRALLAHLAESAPQAAAFTVDTIYFGGGTPSYYGAKRLCELLSFIRKKYKVDKNAEITLEANPDSVDLRSLKRLRRAGFNRISLGVQSASDCQLSDLHRPHSFAQAEQAIAWARKARFQNVSVDLIYGLPGQDEASWQETVEKVLALEPQHISAYGLKVEDGTPLCRRVESGEVLPDDDAQADWYLWAVERLAQAGYEQYEISNFAKPGLRSRHNWKYWMTQPYMGFGPGAHSDFGARRYSFLRDLEGYIKGVLEGGAIIDEDDQIPQSERSGEYLMLRLRTAHGIEEWEYRRTYFMNFDPIAQRLAEYETQGLVCRQGDRWRLTPNGFLLSNRIIGELLELQEQATLANTLERVRDGVPK